MDQEAERLQLESEKAQLHGWLENLITRKIEADNKEQQEAAVVTILEHPITDLESFFKHFEAVGHLRGLRRSSPKLVIQDRLEEIEDKLREIKQ